MIRAIRKALKSWPGSYDRERGPPRRKEKVFFLCDVFRGQYEITV